MDGTIYIKRRIQDDGDWYSKFCSKDTRKKASDEEEDEEEYDGDDDDDYATDCDGPAIIPAQGPVLPFNEWLALANARKEDQPAEKAINSANGDGVRPTAENNSKRKAPATNARKRKVPDRASRKGPDSVSETNKRTTKATKRRKVQATAPPAAEKEPGVPITESRR